MVKARIVLFGLLLLVAAGVAQDTLPSVALAESVTPVEPVAPATPVTPATPDFFPVWVWALLTAVLPVIYAAFLKNLSGPVKQLISWLISLGLVVLLTAVFFRPLTLETIAAQFAVLVALHQAIYGLLLKPAAKHFSLPVFSPKPKA